MLQRSAQIFFGTKSSQGSSSSSSYETCLDISMTGSASEQPGDEDGDGLRASDAATMEVIDLFFVGRSEGPSEMGGRPAEEFARTDSFLPFEPK